MQPRLIRAVELPERSHRPLLVAATLAVLFACGAHNYMRATERARPRAVELAFDAKPAGTTVIRERDGVILCRTPCRVLHPVGRFGVTGFRFSAEGHQDRRVLVNLAAGASRVDAVLAPRPLTGSRRGRP
jgi:hypothetical protein